MNTLYNLLSKIITRNYIIPDYFSLSHTITFYYSFHSLTTYYYFLPYTFTFYILTLLHLFPFLFLASFQIAHIWHFTLPQPYITFISPKSITSFICFPNYTLQNTTFISHTYRIHHIIPINTLSPPKEITYIITFIYQLFPLFIIPSKI